MNMIDDSWSTFFFYISCIIARLQFYYSFPQNVQRDILFWYSNFLFWKNNNNNANFPLSVKLSMMRRKLLESTVTTIRVTQNFRMLILSSLYLKRREEGREMDTIVILRERERETLTRCNFWITQHSPCRIWGASQVHRLWGSSRRVE